MVRQAAQQGEYGACVSRNVQPPIGAATLRPPCQAAKRAFASRAARASSGE